MCEPPETPGGQKLIESTTNAETCEKEEEQSLQLLQTIVLKISMLTCNLLPLISELYGARFMLT